MVKYINDTLGIITICYCYHSSSRKLKHQQDARLSLEKVHLMMMQQKQTNKQTAMRRLKLTLAIVFTFALANTIDIRFVAYFVSEKKKKKTKEN